MYSNCSSSPDVDDDAAVAGLLHPRALVLDAAERGALDRRRLGIERVDLDDPAEAVRLVGLDVDVEPRVGRVPEVAGAAALMP